MSDPEVLVSTLELERTDSDNEKAYNPSLAEKSDLAAEVHVLESEILAVGADIEEAMEAAEKMSPEEIDEVIRYMVSVHDNDPNFPAKVRADAHRYLEDTTLRDNPDEFRRLYTELKTQAALITINSPYAEVRAIVDNHDDMSLPSSTFRSWFIGLVYVALGAFINQFFSIRQPGILVTSNVAQLVAFPAGKLLESVLPMKIWSIFGHEMSLNPGPFNMKEHIVITIMANVGFNTPYTNDVIFVQNLPRFFNQSWASNFGYQLLVGLSTNFIGYGLAGLTRRFLVYPAAAIWPSNLATIALNRAFHSGKNERANGWKVSRMRYFLFCFSGMFCYFWFPNYIFQALSVFNWTTWFAPNNASLAAMTGTWSGLGLNPVPTFDWNWLVIGGDPLINPFFTMMNSFMGAVITLPIIAALWYNNIFNTAYLPINSNGIFDNTGNRYNVSLTVNEGGLFDEESYAKYSPAYLSASNILIYGVFFALYAATLSHAYLYHRREISSGFRSMLARKPASDTGRDIHTKLMSRYKEVPEAWYLALLAAAITLGAIGVGKFPTETSPAVVLYGIALAVVFCVPIGIIQSVTNIQITMNVLAEFFGGLLFQGNANAMNFFKSYGYITTANTVNFAQDLKLAHYVKIPPRVTFTCQSVATLVSTLVCVGILNFQMTQIPDVCSETQPDHFTCPGVNTFFTASVLWGTLGPNRMFGSGKIYNGLLYCFLIGFALPPLFYFAARRWKSVGYVHIPVVLFGGLIWSPFNISNIWPAMPFAFMFNLVIKRKYLPWWGKYNYITSSAFSTAIAISAIIMFFGLQWTNITISWEGNNRPFAGCDGAGGCPHLPLPAAGFFGPGVGEFN